MMILYVATKEMERLDFWALEWILGVILVPLSAFYCTPHTMIFCFWLADEPEDSGYQADSVRAGVQVPGSMVMSCNVYR
jgi:hypothetical protein